MQDAAPLDSAATLSQPSTAATPNGDTATLGEPSTERPRFTGRLVKGAREPDEHGDALTVDELRALELRGAPVAFEHKEWAGRVGTITDSYVDDEGWLWIAGELYSERDRPGAELPGFLRENLRNNNLRDLSISYTYERDPVTKRRCGPRRFREASLVARGYYEGTHLVAVQASLTATHGTLSVAQRLVCEIVTVAASKQAAAPTAASRSIPPTTTTTAMSSNQQPSGASPTPAGVTEGMSVQQVLDTAARAGVQLQAQEIANKSAFELMALVGKKMQDKASLIERAEEITRRDQERHALEYGKRFQDVKALAAAAGYEDSEGLGLAEALYMNPDAAGAARVFSAVAEGASKTRAELEAERKVRAEMEAKMKEVESRLSEYEARDQLSAANQRKRAGDGRFEHGETQQQQRLPARMATGGSTTTTTTSSAQTPTMAGADGGGAETLVSIEASAAKHLRGRGDDAMAARAQQILGQARSLFPHATHSRRAFASSLSGEGSATISVQASAETYGSVAGGISKRDRELIQRLINGGGGGRDSML